MRLVNPSVKTAGKLTFWRHGSSSLTAETPEGRFDQVTKKDVLALIAKFLPEGPP